MTTTVNNIETITELQAEILKAQEEKIKADAKLSELERQLEVAISRLQELGQSIRTPGLAVAAPPSQRTYTPQPGGYSPGGVPQAGVSFPPWFMKLVIAAALVALVFVIFAMIGKPPAQGQQTCTTTVCAVPESKPLIQRVQERRVERVEARLEAYSDTNELTAAIVATLKAITDFRKNPSDITFNNAKEQWDILAKVWFDWPKTETTEDKPVVKEEVKKPNNQRQPLFPRLARMRR